MTTDDFLINYAYAQIWCAPEQDKQSRLRPARITPKLGARGSVDILWTRFNLPTQDDRYHVFQFGNIALSNLGISLQKNVWTAVSAEMYSSRLLIDLYTDRGMMLPRNHAYFLYTSDGNLIIAVMHIPVIADVGHEPVYVRFYSNAFLDRDDINDPQEGIEHVYGKPVTNSQINALGFKLRDLRLKSGHCFIYVNGWLANEVNTSTVTTGDHVEIVRDSTVTKVEEFVVKDLPVFLSELDKKQKYLIHPKPDGDEGIWYRDDQEIYLTYKKTPYIHKGVFYHKNVEDAVRMVTHRDYSIPVSYVDRFTSANPNWAVSSQLTAQVYFRRGGIDRSLIHEAHHIKELYRLPEDKWLGAIMGTEAVVDVWRIEELEKSQYTACMRAPSGGINRTMVEGAYGYNALAKILGDTPQKITSPKAWTELPFGLRGESTIYEYDSEGRLLGWYLNQNVQDYVPRSDKAVYIEGIIGRGGKVTNTVYGDNATVKTSQSYRCYICPIDNLVPTGAWTDVTDNSKYYDFVNGQVVWKTDPKLTYTAVKFDDMFLTYNLELDYPDKLLRFSLNVSEVRVNGNLYNGLVEIPAGLLELWLNGYSLIENLDWFMVNGQIIIANKQFRMPDGGKNVITVRHTGFCNPDMSRPYDSDHGWVDNGLLSKNNRWNLRDDKVIRIIADGRIFSRDEVSWAEDHPIPVLKNVRNGAPYQVLEGLIPLQGRTIADAYELRELAIKTDAQVEDYLSLKLPEGDPSTVNLIPRRHILYSPFCAKVMHDLDHGYFDQLPLSAPYSNNDVRRWCKDYEWLIDFDPAMRDMDERYVSINAHEGTTPFSLELKNYNFLARAVKVMLKGNITLTTSITIDHGVTK